MVAEALFERHGVEPRVRMELSTNQAIREAILAGLGVSILPRHMLGLGSGPVDLVVLDVEGLPIERPWQIVYPVGKQVTAIAQAFMAVAREQAPRLTNPQ
jgi:DNA-binding transcriptional LysR family regulator